MWLKRLYLYIFLLLLDIFHLFSVFIQCLLIYLTHILPSFHQNWLCMSDLNISKLSATWTHIFFLFANNFDYLYSYNILNYVPFIYEISYCWFATFTRQWLFSYYNLFIYICNTNRVIIQVANKARPNSWIIIYLNSWSSMFIMYFIILVNNVKLLNTTSSTSNRR